MRYKRNRHSSYSKERHNRYSERENNRLNIWLPYILTIVLFLIVISVAAKCVTQCFEYRKKGHAVSVNEIGTNEKNVNNKVCNNGQSIAKTELQVTEERLEKPSRLMDRPEIMLYKPNFIVSYNTTTFCPNYVAWHLTRERVTGEISRINNFHPDESLPYEYQVISSDYSNSGYDRGHMCPAADNKDSYENMRNSFLLTNICPQNRNLNAGDWQNLEIQCRDWVMRYGDLYIVCGPIFNQVTYNTIGKKDRMKIAIPDVFFKVVLYMGESHKCLGFIYSNEATNHPIRYYCKSVDEVEEITGIDFYPLLPDEIENVIESECNPNSWNI